jgi:hypothetical protein
MLLQLPFAVRIVRAHHRAHAHLTNLLLVTEAIGEAAYKRAQLTPPVGANPVIVLGSGLLNAELVVPAYGYVEPALYDSTPEIIDIMFRERTPPQFAVRRTTKGYNGALSYMMGAAISLYFDQYEPWIKNKWGQDPTAWPPPLNFWRVVRNAAAHGGRLEIRNANTKPVEWHCFSYGPTDSGKPIIGPEIDMVELALLMIEANDTLGASGAPIV